jgi:hypothetical protein
LLRDHPAPLAENLAGILRFGALLGYEGPEIGIISANHPSSALAAGVIDDKLAEDLARGRVKQCLPAPPFISSPLGLVPKGDGGFRRIHDLSTPTRRSVNDRTPDHYKTLTYTRIEDVYAAVLAAGRGAIILKRDIRDAFRNVPVSPANQWLLGFEWRDRFYTETCLPFGLGTAPFLFNIFAEALHWAIEARIRDGMVLHYLDDFLFIIPPGIDIAFLVDLWIILTDYLGIPRNDDKDRQGQIVDTLGIEIDTLRLEARLSEAKLEKARAGAEKLLRAGRASLAEMQEIGGFLAFCARVTRYGPPFLASLWAWLPSLPRGKRQRRLPRQVIEDLRWWHELLPRFNGILLLDTSARPLFRVFTDACPKGIGGFFYEGLTPDWSRHTATIMLEHTFYMPVADAPPSRRASKRTKAAKLPLSSQRTNAAKLPPPPQGANAAKLPLSSQRTNAAKLPPPPQGANAAKLPLSSQRTFAAKLPPAHINVLETQAILVALRAWGHTWRRCTVHFSTDSTTVFSALQSGRVKGDSAAPLREIFRLASQWDIVLSAFWLSSEANGLADAISRRDDRKVANLCPQLQEFPPPPPQNNGDEQ